MFHVIFSVHGGWEVGESKTHFWSFSGETQNGGQFSIGGGQTMMKLWYRGKEVLTKQVLESTHKENINKSR